MPRRPMHRFFASARGSLVALVASAMALHGPCASAQIAGPGQGQGQGQGDGPGVSRSIQAGFDGAVMAAGGQPLLIDRLATSAIRVGERHVFADFPLSLTETVDIEVVRKAAPGANLPAVVVGAGGVRRAVSPAPLEAFAGTVVGDPGSRVIIAIGEDGLSGIIETGGRRFMLTSGKPSNPHAPAAFDMASPQFKAIDWVPFVCGLETAPAGAPAGGGQGGGAGFPGGGQGLPAGGSTAAAAGTCNAVELALDSDNAFLELFDNAPQGSVPAALAYMQKLVFFASEIYDADVQVQFDLSYWRLWESPDPWVGGGLASRRSEFTAYWVSNEGAVHRDLAQLLCGDNIGGGMSTFDGVCSPTKGYAVNGSLRGSFPTPLEPDDQNWDIVVFTHEMGHNFNATHTHDLPVPPDCCVAGVNCAEADCETSNRGTIMSYCHLCDGGLANILLEFAAGNIGQIKRFVDGEDKTFTANPADDRITVVGHTFAPDYITTRCEVSSANTLPGGLAAGTTYFLVDVEPDSFQLALTPGGNAIDITSAGSGAHTLTVSRIADCLSSGECPNSDSSCVASVSPSQFTIGKDGGCFSVTVATNVPEGPDGPSSDPECEWTVENLPAWIFVSDPDCSATPSGELPAGNEGGRITFRARANATPVDRDAQFTVGGRTVTVLQRSGSACGLSLSTNHLSARSLAGSIAISKLVASGCSWTATSDADWLSLAPASGTSATTAATVNFTANAAGTARTGTIRFLAAGQTDAADAVELVVTQVPAAGCSYTLSTAAISASAEAGRYPVELVTSSPECAWTAGVDSDWIAVGPGGEAGSRAVYVSVQENRTSVARVGKVYIGGKVVTVTQAAGPNCSLGAMTLSSASITTEAGSGSTELTVAPAASWCEWTATENCSWVTVSPSSGVGTDPVTISWTPNRSLSSRSCSIAIGNKTFVVNQQAASGTGSLANWKSVGGISAVGNSSRNLVVPLEAKSLLRMAYTMDARAVGTSHLSELILRVEVPGMPSRFMSVRPSSSAAGGTCQCSGSSTTNLFAGAPFDIPAGTTELKVFCYELADDGGPGQLDSFISTGTVTLTFGVQQGCSYAVGETDVAVPSGAGSGTVQVSASGSTCVWSATSNRSWLTVGAGGAGSRTLTYQYERNPTAVARTATITAAGKTITVSQPGTLPWTPHDLGATKVWLRADEIPASYRLGGLVSKWPDMGPGGNYLTASGTTRPLFVAAGINGKPVVRFDGVDDTLTRGAVASLSNGSAGGALLVVRRVATTAANTSRPVAFLSTGASAGVPRMSLATGTLGKAVAQGRRPDSGSLVTVTSSTAVPATNVQLHAAVLDVAGSKLLEYVNGLKVGQASLGTSGVSSAVAASKALRIGSTGLAGEKPFGGDVAEVIVLSGPLTECQRQMIEGYLAHRWGFASSLPASHPYRTAAPDTSSACE